MSVVRLVAICCSATVRADSHSPWRSFPLIGSNTEGLISAPSMDCKAVPANRHAKTRKRRRIFIYKHLPELLQILAGLKSLITCSCNPAGSTEEELRGQL